jgi:multidrug resistance efflux pump
MKSDMSIEKTRAIHTPFAVRLKRVMRKFGPPVVWIVVAAGVIALVQVQPQYGATPGMAELVETAVAPMTNGSISQLAVELLDNVKPGQTLAVLDDGALNAEQATANAELAQLHARLEAEQKELDRTTANEQHKNLEERRRFAMNEEEARLDHLQMVAQQDSDKVELERLRLTLQREEELVGKGMTTRESYDNARLYYESMQKKVRENEAALAAADRMRKESEGRLAAFQNAPEDLDLNAALEPLRKSITVQEARIAELQQQRKSLILTSPGEGQVTSILMRAGETVKVGQPVMMVRIVNSLRVVAYIEEKEVRELLVGSRVKIASRYRPQLTTEAEVVRVGEQIQPLPTRLLSNPSIQESGLPIILSSLKDQVFYPGECVNVFIDWKEKAGCASSLASMKASAQ